nr:uncharacterized protein LOC111517292 [Leptinotarsa decemlineata]
MVRTRRWLHYKRAFLFQSTQRDFQVLKICLKLGKYCGVSPINMQYNEHTATCTSMFSLILFLLFSVRTLSSHVASGLVIFDLISFIWIASMLLFIASNLRSNFTTKNNWISFLDYLTRMEQILATVGFQMKQRSYKQYVEVSLILVIYLMWFIVEIYQILSNIKVTIDIGNLFVNCSVMIHNFYSTVLFIYIKAISELLEARYGFIDTKLREFVAIGGSKNGTLLKTVSAFLKLSERTVEEGNIVLGWQFFLETVIGIQYVLHLVLILLFHNPGWGIIARTNFAVIIHTICIISMVLSCDALERIGKEITNTCYELHLRSINVKMKKKLLHLAKYSNQMRPIFSAAGFFDINQCVLNAIFATIMNFSVTLIQFNMVLSK